MSKKYVPVRLEPELLARVDGVAARLRGSRSHAVRYLLEAALSTLRERRP